MTNSPSESAAITSSSFGPPGPSTSPVCCCEPGVTSPPSAHQLFLCAIWLMPQAGSLHFHLSLPLPGGGDPPPGCTAPPSAHQPAALPIPYSARPAPMTGTAVPTAAAAPSPALVAANPPSVAAAVPAVAASAAAAASAALAAVAASAAPEV